MRASSRGFAYPTAPPTSQPKFGIPSEILGRSIQFLDDLPNPKLLILLINCLLDLMVKNVLRFAKFRCEWTGFCLTSVMEEITVTKNRLLACATLLCLGAIAADAAVTFSTFVNGGAIAAVDGGNHDTIGFTFAGNKFVGSVYNGGAGNRQLYQTDLSGGSVTAFGNLLPTASGEIVLGSSLGLGGFANGDVFAGSGGGTQIYHYANAGGAATLFSSLLPGAGAVRQIIFNTGGSFGGDMLVSTNNGTIYRVNSLGVATLLANVGEDTEGMDIATSNWGAFAGQLLVDSEGSGHLRFISSTGVVTLLGITVPIAETVSFVPLNLGSSGNPLEGFYVANYPVDVQKAGVSSFAGLQGDLIVTSEDGSSARVWDIKFSGGTAQAPVLIGNLPNQSEDGIFVTAQRISLATPEPSSIVLLGSLMVGLGHVLRRRLRRG